VQWNGWHRSCPGHTAGRQQAEDIWRLREGVAEALSRAGAAYKYDVSVPTEQMYGLVEEAQRVVGDPRMALAVGYGHIGDGNLHLNVSVPTGWDRDVEGKLEPWIYERVAGVKGSISAEHGLGQAKHNFLPLCKGEAEIGLMRALKSALDPRGILNPYKYLPAGREGSST